MPRGVYERKPKIEGAVSLKKEVAQKVKQAMELAAAPTPILDPKAMAAKLGLAQDTASCAIRLSLARVAPREMSGVEAKTLVKTMKLPMFVHQMMNGSGEYQNRVKHTVKPNTGASERHAMHKKRQKNGEDLPLFMDQDKEYIALTRRLVEIMPKLNITKMGIYWDLKSQTFMRNTVRVAESTDPIGTVDNKELFNRAVQVAAHELN